MTLTLDDLPTGEEVGKIDDVDESEEVSPGELKNEI